MTRPPNPFAGISLTDQTSMRPKPSGQDQRLFSQAPVPTETPTEEARLRAPKTTSKKPTTKASTAPRMPDTTADTMVSGNHDTTVSPWQDDWVTGVVRLLRRPGKESATLRLTAEEKTQLRDLVYTYTRQGRRTSETELIRVAIHALMADYEAHGQLSALARVMAALEP